MERIVIGSGNEHEAYMGQTGVVLKTPNAASYLSYRISGGAKTLRDEIKYCTAEAAKSGVRTPERNHVFEVPRGYVIGQDFIPDDGSLTTDQIATRVGSGESKFIQESFEIKPENFLSFGGEVYLVDLTFGYARFLNSLINIEVKNHYKLMVLKLARKLRGLL